MIYHIYWGTSGNSGLYLDEIYEKFGVDYNLMSQILRKDIDENGHSYVRWGSQKIA